jgi:hypothetical protein
VALPSREATDARQIGPGLSDELGGGARLARYRKRSAAMRIDVRERRLDPPTGQDAPASTLAAERRAAGGTTYGKGPIRWMPQRLERPHARRDQQQADRAGHDGPAPSSQIDCREEQRRTSDAADQDDGQPPELAGMVLEDHNRAERTGGERERPDHPPQRVGAQEERGAGTDQQRRERGEL